MNCVTMKVFIIFVVIVGFQHCVVARPNRVKRLSDQHLADLETRIALNTKLNGIAITMPVGGGEKYGIDPMLIGRKRRSERRNVDPIYLDTEEDEGDPRGDPLPLTFEELMMLAKIGLRHLRNV